MVIDFLDWTIGVPRCKQNNANYDCPILSCSNGPISFLHSHNVMFYCSGLKFTGVLVYHQMAEALQASGFLERVSPYLRGCYEGGDHGWLEVYRLLIQLITALLHSLRHLFLQDAVAFVVLHLDRLRLVSDNEPQAATLRFMHIRSPW